ncbi:MAG: hypothetical protein ACREVG_04955, partial [Burkholderiales bacterium]
MKRSISTWLLGFLLVAVTGAFALCPGAFAAHWPASVVHTSIFATGKSSKAGAPTPDTELAGKVRGALHAT